jgi:hypothetical protein
VEGDRHAEAVLRRAAATAAVLVLAGCGGGSKGLAASCKRQRAELGRIAPVRSLGDAQTAVGKTIEVEERGLSDLRRAKARPVLVAAYERALADARRLQASLAGADPTQTMSPLQIGPSAGRRTLERARLLVRRTCLA